MPNFFAAPATDTSREDFLTLIETGNVKIERIASHGAASPAGFWYDQAADEWVMLVRGHATLEFQDRGLVELRAGDWEFIAAHVRHRVSSTSQDALWLAVHVGVS